MAKSKAETRTYLRNSITLLDNARDYLNDEFMVDWQAVKDAVDTGDPLAAWLLHEALEDLADAANEFWVAHRAAFRTVHYILGEYAGVEDPLDSEAKNISAFNQKLIDDSESFDELNPTKTAFTAGGSNTGDSNVHEINVDANGDEMEACHKDTLQLKCIGIGTGGRTQWSLAGSPRTRFLFDDEMGTGSVNGGYMFDWGHATDDFAPAIKMLRTNDKPVLVEWDGSDPRNMIQNGDMEAPIGSGNSKIVGAEIKSGEANIAYNATAIKGDQSLEISGDAALEFPITGGGRVGLPMAISAWIQRVSTFTGTLTIKFRSGASTDHWTYSKTISTMTAGVNEIAKAGGIIPNAVGANPRIRIEVASSGGSGSILIDELVCGLLSLFDSNRAIRINAGPTASVRGDVHDGSNDFTGSNSVFQRAFMEIFGRSITHSSGGSYWVP